MEIKVLGTGCPKCKALEKKLIDSLAELDIDSDVKAAFGDKDRELLEEASRIIGDALGRRKSSD